MDVQQYIQSGIIDSCILGLASPEEMTELDLCCQQYPEILHARQEAEQRLERHCLQHATAVPAKVKAAIIEKLEFSSPASGASAAQAWAGKPLQPVRGLWTRYIAAAALILLIISTGMNLYLFLKYKESITRYDTLVSNQTQIAQSNEALQTHLHEMELMVRHLKDPSMAVVKMSDMPSSPAPGCMATIYWDMRSKDVYLMVNRLPAPTQDKQYQLWAVVDGKMVDAGVFDLEEGMPLVKMKNIPSAQAFAISLEKKGGNAIPTHESMYVMGRVTG